MSDGDLHDKDGYVYQPKAGGYEPKWDTWAQRQVRSGTELEEHPAGHTASGKPLYRARSTESNESGSSGGGGGGGGDGALLTLFFYLLLFLAVTIAGFLFDSSKKGLRAARDGHWGRAVLYFSPILALLVLGASFVIADMVEAARQKRAVESTNDALVAWLQSDDFDSTLELIPGCRGQKQGEICIQVKSNVRLWPYGTRGTRVRPTSAYAIVELYSGRKRLECAMNPEMSEEPNGPAYTCISEQGVSAAQEFCAVFEIDLSALNREGFSRTVCGEINPAVREQLGKYEPIMPVFSTLGWIVCWHAKEGYDYLVAYQNQEMRDGVSLMRPALDRPWSGERGRLLNNSLKMCYVEGTWFGEAEPEWYPKAGYIVWNGREFAVCEEGSQCTDWVMSEGESSDVPARFQNPTVGLADSADTPVVLDFAEASGN